MPEFFNVLAPEAAFEALAQRLELRTEAETAATSEALGRVTAGDVLSPEDLPAFSRSTITTASAPWASIPPV